MCVCVCVCVCVTVCYYVCASAYAHARAPESVDVGAGECGRVSRWFCSYMYSVSLCVRAFVRTYMCSVKTVLNMPGSSV